MPPADAPGFCKEICRFQRPKSGAVNAKTKSILAFTIIAPCIARGFASCKAVFSRFSVLATTGRHNGVYFL